jgi:hypothetical protein
MTLVKTLLRPPLHPVIILARKEKKGGNMKPNLSNKYLALGILSPGKAKTPKSSLPFNKRILIILSFFQGGRL